MSSSGGSDSESEYKVCRKNKRRKIKRFQDKHGNEALSNESSGDASTVSSRNSSSDDERSASDISMREEEDDNQPAVYDNDEAYMEPPNNDGVPAVHDAVGAHAEPPNNNGQQAAHDADRAHAEPPNNNEHPAVNVHPPNHIVNPPPPEDNNVEHQSDSDNSSEHSGHSSHNSQGSSRSSDTSRNNSESARSHSESENSDNDGDPDPDPDPGNQPLFAGAPLRVACSVIAILTFSMVHKLTGVALASLLELIALHCPAPNRCLTSLYKFKNYFANIGRKTLQFHYFCSECFSSLQTKNEICAVCQHETEVSFFIEIPLFDQLQRMFLRPGFVEDLQYKHTRRKSQQNNIEDLYDGELYKSEEINGGFLSNENAISFMIYWDGLKVFKSSSLQIWPLCLIINELSFSKRSLKENIILAGLWFGKSKPKTNLFLQPFHTKLTELQNEGYRMNVPDNRPPILVKGKVLCCTCDLPARANIMGMMQFNGSYGCSCCKSRGVGVPAAEDGGPVVLVHPYVPPEDKQLRNNEEVIEYCEQAAAPENNGSYLGFKFMSLLYLIMTNMISGMAIDIMHCVFLGIIKRLTKFWFDRSMRNMPFSCYEVLDVIDDRLKKIKVPCSTQRPPRSVKKEFELWKASEFKNFFFYYSLPVLDGILEERYLHHHAKLVSAIYLLNQNSIYPEQIESAERLLNSYVREFEELYGLRYMTMNVHMLLHLPRIVRKLGPLWVYSCFFMEDLLGGLARLVHGTRHAGIQICSSATLYMSLSSMISKLPAQSPARNFCEKNNSIQGRKVKISEVIGENLYAVGRYEFPVELPQNELQHLREKLELVGDDNGHFQVFKRLKRKGFVIFSESYSRLSEKASTFVSVTLNNVPMICKVLKFVRWSHCHCRNICNCVPARFLCVVRLCEREPWFALELPGVRLAYLSKVLLTDRVNVADVSEINNTCFDVKINDNQYVCQPVNSIEKE